MFEVLCFCETYNFATKKEVMDFVEKIHKDYNESKQVIIIKSNKTKNSIEICGGLKEKSMLFYVPHSNYYDSLISFDENIPCNNADKGNIQVNMPNEGTFRCYERSLIDYENAIKALKYFLENEKIDLNDEMEKYVSWHAW